MLRPTIYIASKELCLLTARWRAAEAALTAPTPETEPRPAPPVEDRPLVAAGEDKD